MVLLLYVAEILSLCRLLQATVTVWDSKKPVVVPVGIRRGHDYLIEIDSNDRFSAIAVMVSFNEIAFAAYTPPPFKFGDLYTQCVNFETLRGLARVCGEFFLLSADFYEMKRMAWDVGMEKCNRVVQFHYSIPVLIKYDVTKPESPKFVGTYYISIDLLSYIDHNGNREIIRSFKARLQKKMMSPTKYEILCAVEWDY